MKAKPSPALLAKGQRVLARVLGENSELRDLWQEGDDASAWEASIKALQHAVGA